MAERVSDEMASSSDRARCGSESKTRKANSDFKARIVRSGRARHEHPVLIDRVRMPRLRGLIGHVFHVQHDRNIGYRRSWQKHRVKQAGMNALR